MQIKFFTDEFALKIPVAMDGVFWNGRPDEFSNLKRSLDFSQQFGLTPFAKTGVYGYWNGKPRVHNGIDLAGAVGTPIVAPCRCWCSYAGYDKGGYGNFVFMETETVQVNGDRIKLEMVLAHFSKTEAKYGRWYKEGEVLGLMGSTGFSTGPHLHFGVRPLMASGSNFIRAVDDENARGYVDPTLFMSAPPFFDKQILLNEQMKLIKKKGDINVYAISPKGKACLIQNWFTFQRGLEQGFWTEQIEEVNTLPELGAIIVLTPDN